ncbi:nitrilase-related carbon-nitrogen hydrolase [Streptomyces johnsoniae]|uniref:Nitrilase-related carbon-nitrogen hydrolase n=1 Tax=Streptomyces johnsoniae TaxID=3075532 RepID=A0ABU2S2Y3_9ACTN|nr:nitrilase-related carbon-nitrogen hydrolase [Streptomyces sp. DSM 41886]MDT0442445.1 nitrilase-related carbon-nitrogen hydrolase [Streptomyces sp. DSM 41886]
MTPPAGGTGYRVACAQLDPVLGDTAGNIARTCDAIRAAADAGARLVVLPEAVTSGYVFRDAAEAAAYAEPLDGGPAVTAWHRLAARLGLWIAGGVVERAPDGRVFNSAVLVGPAGRALTYRKVHLWNAERELYAPGDLGFPVADTPLGRIGLLICYDAWFPESLRSLALAGADLVCAVSDWVPVPDQVPGPPMANLLCVTGAHSNQLYIAAASRTGVERGQRFIGSSIVTDHTGRPLAGPAPRDTEALIHAHVDPVGTREARRTNPFNRPLHDRRPEAYRTCPPPNAPPAPQQTSEP